MNELLPFLPSATEVDNLIPNLSQRVGSHETTLAGSAIDRNLFIFGQYLYLILEVGLQYINVLGIGNMSGSILLSCADIYK